MEHDLFTQFKKMYHSFVLNSSFSAVVLSVSLLLKSPSSPVSCQLQVSTLREPRSSGGKMEGHPWMCLKERFSITIMWPSRQITVPHAPCENRKGLLYTHYDLFTFFLLIFYWVETPADMMISVTSAVVVLVLLIFVVATEFFFLSFLSDMTWVWKKCATDDQLFST